MAFTNVTAFDVTDWSSGTKTSSTFTGGLGKYIRYLYCDFDQGNGTVTAVTLRLYVTDPVDSSQIYHAGQGAPGVNALIFNNYDLSAAGGTFNKWVAVGTDVSAENNNGWLMIPTDSWAMQLAVTGGGTTTAMKIIVQLSDGMG